MSLLLSEKIDFLIQFLTQMATVDANEAKVQFVLGLDSSTQSLKVGIYNTKDFVARYQTIINFDKDLPEFGTNHGVIKSKDGLEVTAPTLMFVKALDLALSNLQKQNCPFKQV